MAVITSATTGLYGTGATWVGGVAPVEGDSVIIACTSTGLETFSTDAAGYIVGSTVITLTGTVLAGSYVVGETVQFGSIDPNYYTITAWVSATKTLTISPLIVAIPAITTIVKCRGHKVTVNGTFVGGDDTATAFTVNGTLYASRATNNSLTVKGDIKTAATVAATIDYGRITTSDQIPAGVTATIILNYSAAMSNYKYGLQILNNANGYFCGATRVVNANTTSAIAVSGTSVTVDNITGWVVGDTIVLPATSGTVTQHEKKTIATLTPGTGTTGTVTFTATTYAHASGCSIGNLSSNVTIKSYNTTNPAYISFTNTNTSSDGRRELAYTSLQYVGSQSTSATQYFVAANTNQVTSPFAYLKSFSIYNGNNSVGLFFNAWQSNNFEITDVGVYCDNSASGPIFYTASGTYIKFNSCVLYFCSGVTVQSGFSQAGQGCIFTSCKFWSSNSGGGYISHIGGAGNQYNSCWFHSISASAGYLFNSTGAFSLNNCLMGSSGLPGTPSTAYICDIGTSVGQVCNVVMTDCLYGTPSTSFYKNLSVTNAQSITSVINKNASVASQELYTYAGVLVRDNATFNRSLSSEKFAPQTASRAFTRTYSVPAPNNTARRVIGYLRYDTTYTNVTPPSVTLSGLGITPVSYTAGASANTWYQFDLSATQTSGADGNLTLTVTGQSTATTGFYWIDGIVDGAFVTASRHYGFLFDSNIYRTVNSVIQQTNEATVGAYTGISINHGTQTITLTSNHTIREIYDYCYYNLSQTANLSQAEFFTSTDGINFTSTYNLTLNGGGITGTGTINLGSKTLTRAGSESSTLPIVYNSGAAALVNISVSSLVANSIVRVYNNTDAVEIYDAVVAGTSLSIPIVWIANKSLTVTAQNVSGATAYLDNIVSTTLTISGASPAMSQALDTIYNSNAISGITCTEFTADYANARINIASGTTTTVQRLYAAWRYFTYNTTGIRTFTGAMTAQDSVNYLINVATLDLKLTNTSGANVTLTGGYLTRTNSSDWIYSLTPNSINPIYDRAYIANSTQIQNMTNLIPALL